MESANAATGIMLLDDISVLHKRAPLSVNEAFGLGNVYCYGTAFSDNVINALLKAISLQWIAHWEFFTGGDKLKKLIIYFLLFTKLIA